MEKTELERITEVLGALVMVESVCKTSIGDKRDLVAVELNTVLIKLRESVTLARCLAEYVDGTGRN